VAAASLVLGGSSCGGGGESPTLVDVTEAFCRSFEACTPNFDTYFASVEECVAGSTDDERVLGGYDPTYESPDCAEAVLAYYGCYWNAYRGLCDEVPSSRCTAEMRRVDTDCVL
jgi:hypothetical protein